jgi:hypothetical protein
MTVGTVVPIMKAERPGDGSDCSACVSSTVPCDAFDVSMIGDCPVTVMLSSRAPTSIVRSSVMNCCVPSGI